MGKSKLTVIVIVCFALIGFILGAVSAEEIRLPIAGGVYHMITSPVLPEDPDPQASLADNLGPYDKTQWRFFRYGYDPDDPEGKRSKYFELKTDWSDEHNFEFGKGYWIISRNPTEIDIEGEPVGERNWIILERKGDGWNQVGNIYLEDFTIGMFPNCNLWVIPVSGGTWYQLNDQNNLYTYYTLEEYAGGSDYNHIGDDPGEVLETGKGYWLRNVWREDVILFFDPAGLTSLSTTNSTNFPGQDFFARIAQQQDPPDPPPVIESSSSVSFSGSSGGGGCFIATTAYGYYVQPCLSEVRGTPRTHQGSGEIHPDAGDRVESLCEQNKPI